ncbi:MAG: hypothetical protein ACPGJS_16010 [Flammeovirgaceae bacterium]
MNPLAQHLIILLLISLLYSMGKLYFRFNYQLHGKAYQIGFSPILFQFTFRSVHVACIHGICISQ